ncbi:MAB_1171c family putative transporter [Sphaerisporangium krabiense]|uniref:DUF6545 domain-containing protein n=1 Tax=Sphaerisporangium krabiense TaxID=763782 RepID=A0A7W9DSE3_9ACTN|nr:MAB_1171c family putative transporter [Sphaerisporangium krabiense]MBB5629094.1 hypothetical protein [Sphaerisporangium krabiense]
MSQLALGILSTLAFLGVLNKLVQVWRAPEDLPLRAMGAFVLCVALAAVLNVPVLRTAVDHAGAGLAKLAVNLLTVLCAYFLMAFFTYSVHGAAARGRLRARSVLLGAASGVMVTAWLLAPEHVRAAPADLANGNDPHATVFVLAALGYQGYALALNLRSSATFSRASARPQLRRGLKVLAVAQGALLCAAVAKISVALVQAATAADPAVLRPLNTSYLWLVFVGIVTAIVGVGYLAVTDMIAAIPVWRRHRRAYRRLSPLWSALNEAFPDLALTRVPMSRLRDALGLRPTHRGYYRRVVEIRDGIVQLGPYYDRGVAEAAEAAGRAAGLSGTALEAAAQAALIADALRRRARDSPAADPHPIPTRGGDDLESDAAWLVLLSDTLRDLWRRPPAAAMDLSRG